MKERREHKRTEGGVLNESLLLDKSKGFISNSLSKAIAYDRTPEIFDEDYITTRDEKIIEELKILKDNDLLFNVNRRDKPIVLTSYQSRIIHALSYAISKEMGKSEDIDRKIKNISDSTVIRRNVNITALTSLIFNGSTRQRNKEAVINGIYELSQIRQVQILGEGENKVRLTAPLIMVGMDIEDLSPEKRNNLDFIEIFFGSIFFNRLSDRFTIITPKLFEVWGKNGRGTELFSVLLSSIFSVYWHYKQAANGAEAKIRKDNKKASKQELEFMIQEGRKKAMTYELNVSSIKQKVTTDYETTRKMSNKFWNDLQNAIEGFKEMNLIVSGNIAKGARGQEKVVFILSETYTLMESGIEDNTRYLMDKEKNATTAF